MTSLSKKKAYSWWIRLDASPTNILQHILNNRCSDYMRFFPVSGQFEAAKLTHFSTAPLRTPTIPRFKRSLLTCGDVQPNPGPTTQYTCPFCTRNVTSRGVSYLCHSCSGCVHLKCSDLKDARQYKRTKDWACKTCSSAPDPPPTSSSNNDQQAQG